MSGSRVRAVGSAVVLAGLGCWITGTALAGEIAGYEPFSPELNSVDAWCSGPEWESGYKLEDAVSGADVWIADDAAAGGSSGARVVVKAGSGEFANTIWDGVYDGDAVWADSNGNGVYDVGGQGGDKTISHIIVCRPPEGFPSAAPSASVPSAGPVPTPSSSPSVSVPEEVPVTENSSSAPELPRTGTGLDLPWWAGSGTVLAGALLGGWAAWEVRRGTRRR